MRKFRIISIIVLFIATSSYVLYRFVIPMPDWLVRTIGILMLIAIFTTAFSTAKIALNRK